MNLLYILAQNPPPATNPSGPPAWTQFVPIALIIGVFYVFLWRNKRTEDRKRTDMLSTLKRGDRVQTIGGIIGNVVEVREGENEVLVKVDETSNTKIRFARSAIHRVVSEEASGTK
ncbi:MAG TPA: preprotein translocase subunit YajC [Tepidisphaeraceae bacterium]|jgi:preprotein translocase subunit YajC